MAYFIACALKKGLSTAPDMPTSPLIFTFPFNTEREEFCIITPLIKVLFPDIIWIPVS